MRKKELTMGELSSDNIKITMTDDSTFRIETICTRIRIQIQEHFFVWKSHHVSWHFHFTSHFIFLYRSNKSWALLILWLKYFLKKLWNKSFSESVVHWPCNFDVKINIIYVIEKYMDLSFYRNLPLMVPINTVQRTISISVFATLLAMIYPT